MDKNHLLIFRNIFELDRGIYEDVLKLFKYYLDYHFQIKVSDNELLRYIYDPGIMMIFYIDELFETEDFKDTNISGEFNKIIFEYKRQFGDFMDKSPGNSYRADVYDIFDRFYEAFLSTENLFFLRRRKDDILEELKNLILLRINKKKFDEKKKEDKLISIRNLFRKKNN